MKMTLGGMRMAGAALATVVLVGATARCGAAQDKPDRPEAPEAPEIVIARGMPFGPAGSYLGVYIAEVDAAAVDRLRLDAERGARVSQVTEDGPAARAGLREDDVIVAWNGAPVESAVQLRRLVSETPAGREVRLTVVRDGTRRELPVEIGERTGPGGTWTMRVPAPEIAGRVGERLRAPELRGRMFALMSGGRLGVGVQTLGEQLGAYFGLGDREGVLVTTVREDSPAAKAGLKAGDVILAFGEDEVASPGDLISAVQAAEEGTISVRLLRDRKERTVKVDLPEASEARWNVAPSAGAMLVPDVLERLERIEIPDLDLPTLFRFERPAEVPGPGAVRT